MKNRDSEQREFLVENERRINKIISLLMLPGVLVGIILITFCETRFFPNVPVVAVAFYTVMQFCWFVISLILIKINPESRIVKYFCVISVETSTFFLSISPGIVLFIAYIIAPLLSCLYFNRRFTVKISVLCYLAMVASIIIRGTVHIAGGPISIDNWLWAYLAGSSIEYILCAILLTITAGLMKAILLKEHLQTQKIKQMQSRLIIGIADLVESKDAFTAQHIARTARYVDRICKKMIQLGYYPDQLNEHTASVMVKAAPLHDLGKMKVPEAILDKPGRLTDEEFEVIKKHPLWGEQIIDKNFSGIEDDEFTRNALMMALTHHEWWNGNGYPLHLSGEEIPLCGRIMAAADVLDALLNVRPYKNAFTIDETMNIFADSAGKQFDPLVAEAVLQIETEIAYLQIDAMNDSTIFEAQGAQDEGGQNEGEQ